DRRVGPDVVSARHFDSWYKGLGHPDLLTFDRALLINPAAGTVNAANFPDVWPGGLRLTYEFEPGAANDGVTVHIPVAVLSRVPRAGFSWRVPGLRHELVTAWLRSLPKALRRSVVPVPDWATSVLDGIEPAGDLLDAMTRRLRELAGIVVARQAW